MKHPRISLFFSFVGVLLLGACASNEDKIVGKWKGTNSIEGNEGGVHMNMEIDEEAQYLANGKFNSDGSIILTLNHATRMTFTYVMAGDWEIREEDLFTTVVNFTLIPVEADDMDQATFFANMMSEGGTGVSSQDEIIELTDEKLRLEDDEGNISKYRKID